MTAFEASWNEFLCQEAENQNAKDEERKTVKTENVQKEEKSWNDDNRPYVFVSAVAKQIESISVWCKIIITLYVEH